MSEPGNGSAEVVLKRLDEQHQKYKFMEMNLLHKKRRYESIYKIYPTFENGCSCFMLDMLCSW